jgi:hypothetical protein
MAPGLLSRLCDRQRHLCLHLGLLLCLEALLMEVALRIVTC